MSRPRLIACFVASRLPVVPFVACCRGIHLIATRPQLSTPFQKFANVSANRLLTRAAPIRATSGEEAVVAEYEAVLAKRCTKVGARHKMLASNDTSGFWLSDGYILRCASRLMPMSIAASHRASASITSAHICRVCANFAVGTNTSHHQSWKNERPGVKLLILWCGERDLFSRRLLKTSKLYITQRRQDSQSARDTRPSHTVSHTDDQSSQPPPLIGGVRA